MSSGPVDFTFHNISIPVTRTGYGLMIDGNSPVLLSDVKEGFVADRAGAKTGDFLIALNGKDVQFATRDEIAASLKYSYGSAMELRIARPHPLPTTDLDRRRAILTLQTKLRTGDYVTCGDEVENYKSKLSNALADVGDILGGFDLPGTDQQVPSFGGTNQEVEIKMYDSDNLSSPPSSKGSEVDLNYDPFLDFSRDDGMVHRHGNQTTSGDITKSVLEMQAEMSKMKDLIRDVSEKSEKKKKSRAAPQNNAPMRTEAAFTPSYPSNYTRTQPAVSMMKSEVIQDLEALEDQVQWVQSPLTSGSHKKPARSAPKKPEKSPSPKPVEKSVSPPKQVEAVPSQIQPAVYSPQHKQTQHKPPPPSQPERGVSPPAKMVSASKPSKKKEPKRTRSPTKRSEKSVSPEAVGHPPQANSKVDPPFRQKEKRPEQLPGMEPAGHLKEDSRMRGKRHAFEPTHVDNDSKKTLSPTSVLPPNVYMWHKEEIGQWIKSISMSLYAHYYPLFSRHQITGQSLLRLTGAKLKMMGITNSVHCRTLATEIAKLKIRQELEELKELQGNDSDNESGIISDL